MRLQRQALSLWCLSIGMLCGCGDPQSRVAADFKDHLGLRVAESETRNIEILPDAKQQVFDGFGTALAWFAHVVGGYSPSVRSDIADLLFDGERGLGMRIVRYNIGGGDAPGHDHMRPGGAVPGFKSESSASYEWTADANQRWFLDAAIARGANILEAFSNSPPWWMTRSACTAGAWIATEDNLKIDRYEEFADYLSEVVRYFRDAWGINFSSLSPVNEPGTAYWHAYGKQEGSHWSVPSQGKIILAVQQALKSKGLSHTRISAMDETDMDLAVREFLDYSPAVKEAIAQFNVHTYMGSERVAVRQVAAQYGKHLWMSETDSGGGVAYDPGDITPALEMAKGMIADLKEMQPSAWVFWQAVENAANMRGDRENSNWGLIHADLEGQTEDYHLTKKYFAFAQFSRFIPTPSRMLAVADANSVAFIDPDGDRLTVVLLNDGLEERLATLQLKDLRHLLKARVIQTSMRGDLLEHQPLWTSEGELFARLLPQSLTTVVFSPDE